MAILEKKIKESFFLFLSQVKQDLLALYQILHPEDTTITENDVQILTLKTALTNQRHDLVFLVRDHRLIFVTNQRHWSPKIAYDVAQEAYHLIKEYQDLQQKDSNHLKSLKMPLVELYVIYSGEEKLPDPLIPMG
ncbi:MAG: hypothetical protein HDR44_01280 [Allobaculum sp.]|nr:hypothetical protein [Allobaculum sp.]